MNLHRPPKLAEKILERLLYDDVWKTMMGDLQEFYHVLYEEEGKNKADRWYWRQIFKYAPSKILHKFIWSIEMFLNYLKISFRNLKKHKSYSFINIFGLTVGLISFILIAIYLFYEISYDNFHPESDQTYMITYNFPENEYMGTTWFALTPTGMASALKEEYPEVEKSTHFSTISSTLTSESLTSNEPGISVDYDFLDMFYFGWRQGIKSTALDDPHSIILTQSLAVSLFGNETAIGQTISLKYLNGREQEKTVTGLIDDLPGNTMFDFRFIINHPTTPYYEYNLGTWSNNNEYTFVRLNEIASSENFQENLVSLRDKYLINDAYYNEDPTRLPSIHTLPLKDIHLNSGHINFMIGNSGNIKYLYLFSVVGFLILLIASLNYMNLATARSLTRAKEIAVRKATGAFRSNLVMQFTSEAVVISLISLGLAVLGVYFLLPAFTNLTDISLSDNYLSSFWFWGVITLMTLIIGVLSGSYPSFYLSKLKPNLILKNESIGGKGNKSMRDLLVVVQFSVTIVLIIGFLVVYGQLDYIQTMNTGLNRDQVVRVSVQDSELQDRYEVLKEKLQSNPNIIEFSTSQFNPVQMSSRTSNVEWEGKLEEQQFGMYVSPVGFNFIEMFGLNVIEGRTFENDLYRADYKDYILNESAIRALGWSAEEAIGKRFNVWGNDGQIVGVVKDFNFLSLFLDIEPLAFMLNPDVRQSNHLIKISSSNTQESLTFLEDTYAEFSPAYPFSYSFLDDSFINQYRSQIKLGTIFSYFTMIALIIACLGLFGLTTFISEQRTKEIGIRKILGANIFQLVALLNQDLLKLITISFILSIPFGWYAANWWLSDFAYRFDLGVGIFFLTAIIAYGIAMLTVSIKSIQTANANPVDSLRSE